MSNLIVDTNIWVCASRNEIDLVPIKKSGNRLLVAPVTIMELCSNLNENNFVRNQLVSKIIEENADGFFNDHNNHLAKIWEMPVKKDKNDWHLINRFFIQASCFNDVKCGYLLDEEMINIDWENISNYYKDTWGKFKEDLEKVRNTISPNLRKDTAEKQKVKEFFLRRTFESGRSETKSPSKVRGFHYEKNRKTALKLLKPYINAVIEYLCECAEGRRIEGNDFGDLLFFYYLQNGNKLLTFDKRFGEIAEKVCPKNYFSI